MTDKRAAIYLRVSGKHQVEHGQGLDIQLDKCRAMLQVKGWHEVGVYQDNGVSGSTMDRPGIHVLAKDCESGTVNVVVTHALSRLGRSTREVLEFAERLAEWDADLVSVTESIDTTTPSGRFAFTVLAAVAELEREMIASRMSDGRRARFADDKVQGGPHTLYGYHRIPRTKPVEVSLVPHEVAAVQLIFRMREGGAILQAITDELNENGTPPPGKPRKGVPMWYPNTVRNVLKHEGRYRGGSEHWPAILGPPDA